MCYWIVMIEGYEGYYLLYVDLLWKKLSELVIFLVGFKD